MQPAIIEKPCWSFSKLCVIVIRFCANWLVETESVVNQLTLVPLSFEYILVGNHRYSYHVCGLFIMPLSKTSYRPLCYFWITKEYGYHHFISLSLQPT